jgi:hypothetical protein
MKTAGNMIKKSQSLNSYDIYEAFIFNTLLRKDQKGWGWFRWPQTRWTTTQVAEKLEAAGYIKITTRSVKDQSVMQAWVLKDVDPAVAETLCLDEKTRKRIKLWIERGLV